MKFVPTPEQVAKIRAEADAREAERRKQAEQEKLVRQARRVSVFARGLAWFKSAFTPAPKPAVQGPRPRTARERVARKQARMRERAERVKMNRQVGGALGAYDYNSGRRLTSQERAATRKGWDR